MIKINLLAERKPTKTKATASLRTESPGTGTNLLLVGIFALGIAVAGAWWWTLDKELDGKRAELDKTKQELKRLEEAIKKSEEYEQRKVLLARKIELITDLKKQQQVPVHIMDQVSRSLPEFLWLDSMSAKHNQIAISGKATTYTAVSNFYSNLNNSGFFKEVSLGRTFEVPEGVSFSLNCNYVGPRPAAEAAATPAAAPQG